MWNAQNDHFDGPTCVCWRTRAYCVDACDSTLLEFERNSFHLYEKTFIYFFLFLVYRLPLRFVAYDKTIISFKICHSPQTPPCNYTFMPRRSGRKLIATTVAVIASLIVVHTLLSAAHTDCSRSLTHSSSRFGAVGASLATKPIKCATAAAAGEPARVTRARRRARRNSLTQINNSSVGTPHRSGGGVTDGRRDKVEDGFRRESHESPRARRTSARTLAAFTKFTKRLQSRDGFSYVRSSVKRKKKKLFFFFLFQSPITVIFPLTIINHYYPGGHAVARRHQ